MLLGERDNAWRFFFFPLIQRREISSIFIRQCVPAIGVSTICRSVFALSIGSMHMSDKLRVYTR